MRLFIPLSIPDVKAAAKQNDTENQANSNHRWLVTFIVCLKSLTIFTPHAEVISLLIELLVALGCGSHAAADDLLHFLDKFTLISGWRRC